VTADVVPLHADAEIAQAAELAHAAFTRYLDRCGLAANTVRAYRRQAAAYVTWLAEHAADHPDAFADVIGAEAAVTRWRRHLLQRKASPTSVNQALAAVTLLYEHGPQLRITVKRARVERPGEPDALTPAQQGAVERAADRHGRRDAAIVAVLLYTGARAEECTRLAVDDVAITPRTGRVRLLGKGDQPRTVPLPARGRERVAAWLLERGRQPGPLWLGQRGPLSVSGVTQVVLAVGRQAGIKGCGRTGCGTPTPPGCGRAAPTQHRFRRCSGMPASKPLDGTSAPAPVSGRPWSSGSSSRSLHWPATPVAIDAR